jgi:hypothetical protein
LPALLTSTDTGPSSSCTSSSAVSKRGDIGQVAEPEQHFPAAGRWPSGLGGSMSGPEGNPRALTGKSRHDGAPDAVRRGDEDGTIAETW